jgi:hypothetical protein
MYALDFVINNKDRLIVVYLFDFDICGTFLIKVITIITRIGPKVVIVQCLSVRANFNAWKVRICSIFCLSLSHHFNVHNAEIHLNTNSVFILASKSSCVTYMARRSALRMRSRSNASIGQYKVYL